MKKILSFLGTLFARSGAIPLVAGVGSVICAVLVDIIACMTVEATLEQRKMLGNLVEQMNERSPLTLWNA